MKIREGLAFADVLLEPKISHVRSRDTDINLSVSLSKGIKLALPIIPANMKTILGIESVYEFYKLGTMAIMHRFCSMEKQMFLLNSAKNWNDGLSYVGFSVGVKDEDYRNVDAFVQAGAKILCVDIAHGHSELGMRMTDYIASKYPDVFLIAGNVCTAEGAKDLWEAGADAIKSGVGCGSLCSTRIMTGNGVPQLTAIADAYERKDSMQTKLGKRLFIISDGGASNYGDCVKALCFSDLVMTGNLLSGCEEMPGEVREIDGRKYKAYNGSSTHKATHKEGFEALMEMKGSIKDTMRLICEGVRSGMSYQGSKNLEQLKIDPSFIRITSAGQRESGAHDIAMVIR
jgi:IMP dehydrogenase